MHDPKVLQRHITFTQPEYVLFVPKQKAFESDNVHLHVIDHPQFGGLIAFWTQSSIEHAGNNHAMMSRSLDNGKTWSEAKFIIGARTPSDKQAHWAFPALSKSGRIYLFYYREAEFYDYHRQITGVFSCIYSDDFGDTWSESYDVPLKETCFDRNGQVQNNCCYQIPRRFQDGKYLFGYTKYTNLSKRFEQQDSHIYFARLENLDDDPLPSELKLTHLPDNETGISVSLGENDSCAQEPCIVQLPDGRLLCTMRTLLGSVYYSVSEDNGHTWRDPDPMRFDDGSPIVHPLSPCPIYDLGEEKYVLLFHGVVSDNIWEGRNPTRKVVGRFAPGEHQPIQFPAGSDEIFIELPEEGREVGQFGATMYGCYLKQGEEHILWYPDRKFFLLGKHLI